MKPTPPELSGALPLLGHALEFQRDRNGLFRRGLEEAGRVFSIKLARQPAAVLLDPDYHRVFFMETDKKLSMHKTYRFLAAMFGEIAFTASPETYQRQRPVLHAPFSREKMAVYVSVMQEEIQLWLDSLGEEGELELTAHINSLVQRVAAHAFMGKVFRQQFGREFWDLYADLSEGLDPLLPPNLPLPKFIRRDRAHAKLSAMLRPIIAERRAHPERYDDFMQDFLMTPDKEGNLLDDEEATNLLLGFMFAGHETTAGQAAWTIIEVLRHPEYKALLEQEVTEKLPPGTELDGKTMRALEHVNWAVQETTRTHPSADMLLRMVEEPVDLGEYELPPGWIVFVNAGTAQRLPDLFTDPDDYDPLRFAPDRAEDQSHRFSIIGFGGGVHKCTGMNFANNEMMAITALLFQQFDLELVTQNPTTVYDLGASRPSPTIIRYRRKQQPDQAPAAGAVAASS